MTIGSVPTSDGATAIGCDLLCNWGPCAYLGTFLADPPAVPAEVVAYVTGQLGIADPSCFRKYADREKTPLRARLGAASRP
jgi:Domain of unknown function (DUF4158)